jgi:hypothetical protein
VFSSVVGSVDAYEQSCATRRPQASFLDPKIVRDLRFVASNLPDETFGVLALDVDLERVIQGERRRETEWSKRKHDNPSFRPRPALGQRQAGQRRPHCADFLANEFSARLHHEPEPSVLANVLAEDLAGSVVHVVVERLSRVGQLPFAVLSASRTEQGAD